MKRIVFVLFMFPFFTLAQQKVNGKISDADNGEPLAFVNIITSAGSGATSDIDGLFSIDVPSGASLIFTYVGYHNDTIAADKIQNRMDVRLKKKSFSLQEVVINPGENPAHRIIRQVIKNNDRNNPEKYDAFSYTSYNKMVFTANKQAAETEVTTKADLTEIQKVDSFLNRQHLFLMESVTKRFYQGPGRDQEQVMASRISGLKDPSFQLLASELQSFSFYGNTVSIAGAEYVSPIAPGSISHYLFIIEDSIPDGKDTVFILSFTPSSGKKFKGMKGLLYIHTDGYALRNVIAEPSDPEASMQVKIQQKYEQVKGQWFPVQLNTDITFNSIKVGPFSIIGMARSYLDSIRLNEEAEKVRFSQVSVLTDPEANRQQEEFWQQYRKDTLTEKDNRTYHVIDSLGKANNLDKKLQLIEALQTGEFPLGMVNLQLNRLFAYNEYEGIRAGLGLITNSRISRRFSLEGYGAYGFRDEALKYGTAVNITPVPVSDFRLRGEYSKDLRESGGLWFGSRKPGFSSESYRNYFLQTFDSLERIAASLRFRAFRYNLFTASLAREIVNPTDNYQYRYKVDDTFFQSTEYSTVIAAIEWKFVFRETFVQTSRNRISTGSKFPALWFRAERSLKEYESGLNFTRLTTRIDSRYKLAYVGNGKLTLLSGMVLGEAPYTWMFTPPATRPGFSVDAENTFQTMPINGYLNDRFIYGFYTHSFGNLLIRTKWFKPEIAVVQHAGLGVLDNPEMHIGREAVDLSQGYFESGIKLNNLLVSSFVGLGISGYWRWGYYSSPIAKENLAIKLTVGFKLD